MMISLTHAHVAHLMRVAGVVDCRGGFVVVRLQKRCHVEQ
jgi:hypothetical protein